MQENGGTMATTRLLKIQLVHFRRVAASMTSRVEFTFQWHWIAIWRLNRLPWASVVNIIPWPEPPLSVQFGPLLAPPSLSYTDFTQPPPSHY